MGIIDIQFAATLENVQELILKDTSMWWFTVGKLANSA